MADNAYIIGIDFGTTYSGVAWCWAGQPDIVQLVTKWKTKLNLTHDVAKTPTEIHYSPGSPPTWGYDVPTDKEPIRWFKLLLADDSDLTPELRNSPQLRRAKELVQLSGKTPVQVIADYLRMLWNHTTDDIIRDRGQRAFTGSPLRIWITVPAIWKKEACQRMREAAKLAGMLDYRAVGETTLDLVAEPEAAAMAVLDDFQGRPDVAENDVFVVCDAGGGTVDIISYVIENTKPIMVRECVEGRGKMCGAIFVDAAFENMLKLALGDRWKKLSPASQKTLMNNEWEFGIKRSFNDRDQEWSVAVPAEAFQTKGFGKLKFSSQDSNGQVPLKSGQLKFSQGQIRQYFNTVIPHIRGLIHEQKEAVKAKCNGRLPKAILLVGGLGSCQYLHMVLQKEFQGQGIDVLQPSGARPWTAICRGAVIRGLSDADIKSRGREQSLIVSRVSRISYGVPAEEVFDETFHDWEDRKWNAREMCFKATNQMSWYIRRGEDVSTTAPVEFRFYRLYSQPIELHTQTFKITVFHNDDLPVPKKQTMSVVRLVSISVRVDTPFYELPTYQNPEGQMFRRINYQVQMKFTGVEMQWRVLINGSVQGEENVQYVNEFTPRGEGVQYLQP